jgi:hypothetical protein
MAKRVARRAKRTESGLARAFQEGVHRAIAAVIEPLERRVMLSATASLIRTDTTTQGNWTGQYGADGYSVVGGSTTLPSYGTFSINGNSFYEWQGPSTYGQPGTTDPRAPQVRSGDSDRVAAADSSDSSFNYAVTITDGNVHQVAFYLLDWDQQSRAETVTVS